MTLACLLTSFYVGNLVYGWFNKQAPPNLKRDLLLGAVIMIILAVIPFLGWLVALIAFLITLGAMLSLQFRRKQTLI